MSQEIQAHIQNYIQSHKEPLRSEINELHRMISEWLPGSQLWFLDGRNAENKIVSNPNIGYGAYTMHLAGGKTRSFYQVGISTNTTGISVYIMGIPDKQWLKNEFAKRLGKATVTGYCIKFKSLRDIDTSVLKEAILRGVALSKNT